MLVHGPVLPIDVPHGLDIQDVDSDDIIPVDLLAPEEAPPAPPDVPAVTEREPEPAAPAATHAQASSHPDAGVVDAASDGSSDAEPDGPRDAAPFPVDAADLDGAAPALDGGHGGDVPDGGDPESLVRATLDAPPAVELTVNAEAIRAHPVGAHLGYLLRGIPQWDEFMSGTDIDPVRDTDWVVVSGGSLRNTANDSVIIHYSAPDRVVDQAIRIVTRKYDRGGPFDAGVPGVKASLAHADRAERVFVRARPNLVAIVPPAKAHQSALMLRSARVEAHLRPGEAVRLRIIEPRHVLPDLPAAITVVRLRVLSAPEGGAEVLVEGDTKDAEVAAATAVELRHFVRRHDDMLVSMLTHGLLDDVEVSSEGATVKARILATRDQIETIAALVGNFLGVQPPGAAGAGSSLRPPRTPSQPDRPR
jgi:hypothetical protein